MHFKELAVDSIMMAGPAHYIMLIMLTIMLSHFYAAKPNFNLARQPLGFFRRAALAGETIANYVV